jgi:hypothetical protein
MARNQVVSAAMPHRRRIPFRLEGLPTSVLARNRFIRGSNARSHGRKPQLSHGEPRLKEAFKGKHMLSVQRSTKLPQLTARETVAFDVVVHGTTIRCEATADWLIDRFLARGPSAVALMRAAQDNMEEILQIVSLRLLSLADLPEVLLLRVTPEDANSARDHWWTLK